MSNKNNLWTMASQAVDLKEPFRDVFQALDLKDQRKAMRSAIRREGNRLKKQATANLQGSGIGQGTNGRLSRGIRSYVYPEKYGVGFLLSTKPHKKQGYHKNRQGKEKPVLMWAEDGTDLRRTKTKTKVFVRLRKSHATGRMRRYGFMRKTEEQETQVVERSLFATFQKNLERAARKKGLF